MEMSLGGVSQVIVAWHCMTVRKEKKVVQINFISPQQKVCFEKVCDISQVIIE